MPKSNDRFQLPADLSTLTTAQLAELRDQADAEFDAIYGAEAGATADQLGRAEELVTARESLTARMEAIATEGAATQARFDALNARRAAKAADPAPVAAPADGATATPAAEPASAPTDGGGATAQSAAPVPVGAGVGGAVTASRELDGLGGARHDLNPSLAAMRLVGPRQPATRAPLAITASVGMPGAFEAGARIPDLRALGDLTEARSRAMPVGAGARNVRHVRSRERGQMGQLVDAFGGVQVASIARQFPGDPLSVDSGPDVIERFRDELRSMMAPARFSAMVAAGGWCAPGENIWDFFSVTGQCGMVDLPTRNIVRGGINVPNSPTVADAYTPDLALYEAAFSNATVPWLWTEADDILTVTGSTNKPCLRVPCSTLTPYRLECYGACITAGNLADNAWPESTAHFLRLINDVHYHASNARYISAIQTLAGAAITAGVSCTGGGRGAAAPMLNMAELAAVDYRARFGACPGDVIEQMWPTWALTAIRADLAKRMGVSDFMAVTDSMIGSWFSARGIRAQFVEDYQVRASGQPGHSTPITALPSAVEFSMWFPGAILRGNGMSLNLGVVRDSTLNAENDHTALWMEECHLIAQMGPAPRRYSVEICPDGTVGAADLTSCCP